MSRLLVYDLRTRSPEPLLRDLTAADGFDVTYTRDPDLFEAALALRGHAFCLFLLDGEPPDTLVDQLARARALHQLVEAASLHTSATPAGLRRMLQLGMREVFVEPVAPSRVVETLRRRITGTAAPAPQGLQPTASAACELHCFGRVARLSTMRPGEIFVECDVELETGADVVLLDPLGLELPRVAFRVLRREERDLYFRYQHGYWLGQPAERRVVDSWAAVVEQNGDALTAAKPRIAWVSARSLPEVERLVSPEEVSLHLVRAKTVDAARLMRIDPALVVLDDPSHVAHEAVATWARSVPGDRVVATADAGPTRWPAVAVDTLVGLAHARAPDPPPGVLYVSRDAAISRCVLAAPAVLERVAPGGFAIASPIAMRLDSLVEVRGAHIASREELGLFGRVHGVEPRGDRQPVRLVCEAVPVSDAAELSLTRAGRQVEEAAPQPVVVAPARATTPSWAVAAAALALGLAAGLAWSHYGKPDVVEEERPASTRATLEGIRKSF